MTASSHAHWLKNFEAYVEAEGHGPAEASHAHILPHPFPFPGRDALDSATSVDVDNLSDIDVDNSVAALQETVASAEVGHGASAIIDEALNVAPHQSGAVGNFGGAVETGQTAVGTQSEILDGSPWFDFGGDRLSSLTDIDVTNTTDIDLVNDVTAIQNTIVDLDVGPHSSAIISESMNAAPSQQLAVGNFDGDVNTGQTEIFVEDVIA